MDDPNLIQNSSCVSSDLKDNMTPMSPKRTIVLGVVNTTGMKSSIVNRKRRWDQPPDEISETPIKKLCFSENEVSSANDAESLDATTSMSNFDRLDSQFKGSELPTQSASIDKSNSEDIKDSQLSPNQQVSSEEMLVDLPDEKSDRPMPPPEPSSVISSCSASNENISEVNTLETSERLLCCDKVNSQNLDSRFIESEQFPVIKTCDTPHESKVKKIEQTSSKSTTVVSHQSDELRRIMFSYVDEGSSDSDNIDSSICNEESSMVNIDSKQDESNKVKSNNIPQTLLTEANDGNNKGTEIFESEISINACDISVPLALNSPLIVHPKSSPQVTDAFIDGDKPLQNSEEVGKSLNESQCNIPNEICTKSTQQSKTAVSGVLRDDKLILADQICAPACSEKNKISVDLPKKSFGGNNADLINISQEIELLPKAVSDVDIKNEVIMSKVEKSRELKEASIFSLGGHKEKNLDEVDSEKLGSTKNKPLSSNVDTLIMDSSCQDDRKPPLSDNLEIGISAENINNKLGNEVSDAGTKQFVGSYESNKVDDSDQNIGLVSSSKELLEESVDSSDANTNVEDIIERPPQGVSEYNLSDESMDVVEEKISKDTDISCSDKISRSKDLAISSYDNCSVGILPYSNLKTSVSEKTIDKCYDSSQNSSSVLNYINQKSPEEMSPDELVTINKSSEEAEISVANINNLNDNYDNALEQTPNPKCDLEPIEDTVVSSKEQSLIGSTSSNMDVIVSSEIKMAELPSKIEANLILNPDLQINEPSLNTVIDTTRNSKDVKTEIVIQTNEDTVAEVEPISINDIIEINAEEIIETELSLDSNIENVNDNSLGCDITPSELLSIKSQNNLIITEEGTQVGLTSDGNTLIMESCINELDDVEVVVSMEAYNTDNNDVETLADNSLSQKISCNRSKKYSDNITSANSGIEKDSETVESPSIEESIYDDTDVIVEESVNSTSYEEAVINPSPEESKDFVESIDISDTVMTDSIVDSNSASEKEISFEDETKASEMCSKTRPSCNLTHEISEEENLSQDDSKTIADDVQSFVVEEVVTCESLGSNKGDDNELVPINNEVSSNSIIIEEVSETSVVNCHFNVVINESTTDSDESAKTNQSTVNLIKPNNAGTKKNVQKHIQFNKDFVKNETLSNDTRPITPLLEMECEDSVNSNMESVPSLMDEEMEVVDEPIGVIDAEIKSDSSDLPPSVQIGNTNIPLLKTVTNSLILRKEKPITAVDEIESAGNILGPDPKLEPITLRIFKDNFAIKNDELDSPKKSKSPKMSSELRSQLSPHLKSSESRSSLSPTTKKLEFTLKIAKDANTNIPRATMSPKSSMSPSGAHKSAGDILRAELTGSGRSSPAYASSSDTSPNKVKLKISKPSPPGLSKEYNTLLVHDVGINQDFKKAKEENSPSISFPTPSMQIGSVFKKMIENDRSTDSLHFLDSSVPPSNPSTPVVRKRGRPRKILNQVLSSELNDSMNPNSELFSTPGGISLNHTTGSLDYSGQDSLDPSSRQVRSCRARTKPIVVKTRRPRGGGTGRGGMRGGGGRGGVSSIGAGNIPRVLEDPEKLAEKLSEREKAEVAKIEERKEKLRMERIAKKEAILAKKLARKLKDEEKRQKRLREKAEKAEAAAPQVFEEETRMSAPDGGSRGHTPAPSSTLNRLNQTSEHYEGSQNSISTPTSSQIKRGRMEIPIDPECKEVRPQHLAEYHWQGSDLNMIQEQISAYLGVKSFKRKYPDLKRRPVEAEEKTFLEESGLVPKSMCDLGITAVSSAEVLDVMYHDFPEKYEEFRKYVREKQAREVSFKQKAVFASLKGDKTKGEPREQALEAVALWNSNLNKERREERRCALDLQTFTIHYPKQVRKKMSRPVPKIGVYPVSVLPGQFTDSYKEYTPTELMYIPMNTVMYGPLKPNERRPLNPDEASDSSSSGTSDDSSSSSSDSESEDENSNKECKICNGEKKTNKDSHPEILLQCSSCKGLCHPTCQEITPEMLPHIKKYAWHCSNCKTCMQCKNTTKDDKMLFCDLCDRGYHVQCVGLKKAPEGRWHCSVCSFCTSCGSKDPGGPEWNYEYNKTDKGIRLYQRTLCVPCSKNALM